MFIDLRERGRERKGEKGGREIEGEEEREETSVWERNINWFPPVHALTWDPSHNILAYGTTPQPTELCGWGILPKLIINLERGEERERGRGAGRERGRETSMEREKHWWVGWLVASPTHLIGDKRTTQVCALTGNWTGDLSLCELSPNQLSHTGPGTRRF